MIEVGEVITLNNDIEYLVTYTTKLDSRDYAFLIEYNDFKKSMFVEYIDGTLKEVKDEEVIKALLKQFMESKKD